MAMLQAGSVDVIEIGGEYVAELQKAGVRTLTMPTSLAVGHPGRAMAWQANLRTGSALGLA